MLLVFIVFFGLTAAFVVNWAMTNESVKFPWWPVLFFGLASVLALNNVVQRQVLEKKLMAVARTLYDVRHPIECVSFFRAMRGYFASRGGGLAKYNADARNAVLAMDVCDSLHDFVHAPHRWTPEQALAVHVLTHEVMHLRGELDEQRTDCQAQQRNAQVAMALGAAEHTARAMAMNVFREVFPHHPYFTDECAPGKSLDENLPTSPWNFPEFKLRP